VIIEVKLKKDKVAGLLTSLKDIKDITYVKFVSYEGDLEEG